MMSRLAYTLVFCLGLALSATGQVVRFETTMGDFDMVLNPTNNPVLQLHVDNMLDYVENNRYLGSWINRADTGFVLQMGGFFSHTKRPPPTIASTHAVQAFAPIPGEPASENRPLSNKLGTVSLALPGSASGTNQNGGTSSFFVNLKDNSGLDTDFTVFAAIPDMTTINAIMALPTIDRTTEPNFGAGGPGNLAFTDVPIQANGFQVFIKRAFVITDAMTITSATSGVQSIMAASAAAAASAFSTAPLSADGAISAGAAGSSSLSPAIVPEPASGLLAIVAALGTGFAFRRRRA